MVRMGKEPAALLGCLVYGQECLKLGQKRSQRFPINEQEGGGGRFFNFDSEEQAPASLRASPTAPPRKIPILGIIKTPT